QLEAPDADAAFPPCPRSRACNRRERAIVGKIERYGGGRAQRQRVRALRALFLRRRLPRAGPRNARRGGADQEWTSDLRVQMPDLSDAMRLALQWLEMPFSSSAPRPFFSRCWRLTQRPALRHKIDAPLVLRGAGISSNRRSTAPIS